MARHVTIKLRRTESQVINRWLTNFGGLPGRTAFYDPKPRTSPRA
jgi:hypothetical protein